MKSKLDVLELTRKLASCPSYVDGKTDEQRVGQYLYSLLSQYPFLQVEKQYIDERRFNVVATTPGKPRLLLAGHMDTVEPKNWEFDQYLGKVEDGKFYGLGALDMKGGIAAIISAIDMFESLEGLTLLFYCDEEYDFTGMRHFIKSNHDFTAELAVVAENTELEIFNTHRGLIELSIAINGVTGHAANQAAGANAIDQMTQTIMLLRNELLQYSDPDLGVPTLNVAYIHGGLNQGEENGSVLLGKQGNNIADYAEAVIEIRTTCLELNAARVISIIKDTLGPNSLIENTIGKSRCEIGNIVVRHDLGSLNTPKDPLAKLISSVASVLGSAKFLDPSDHGYGDGQMIFQKYGIPVVNFGPKGENAHGVNEYVEVESLYQTKDVFASLLEKYCT